MLSHVIHHSSAVGICAALFLAAALAPPVKWCLSCRLCHASPGGLLCGCWRTFMPVLCFACMQIGEDLTYSERLLRFMRMCCCFSFFCACCTEPARNVNDKEWRGGSE